LYFVISALLVPVTAITLPLYLVYAKIGMINSIWSMIVPSMISPVGVDLMRTFIDASVPRELLDAARIDGAGEIRISFRLALPLMIFSQNNLYPLTLGLGIWPSPRGEQRRRAALSPARHRRPRHDRAAGHPVPDRAAVLAQRDAARQYRGRVRGQENLERSRQDGDTVALSP
jgi:hypothetical protein